MGRKLSEMDKLVGKLIQTLDRPGDLLLVDSRVVTRVDVYYRWCSAVVYVEVFGDHGMTDDGNHGGGFSFHVVPYL